MRTTRFQLPNRPIHVYKWEPDESRVPRGVVQLVHGSCEHAGRYEAFARFLTGQGLAVYANDHLGHGKSVASEEDLGFFGDHDGWTTMIDDLYLLTEAIHKDYPKQKLTMLGHSMGSFMARHYAVKYGHHIDGVILSGTAHHGRMLLHLASLIAKWEIWSRGSRFKSQTLFKLSYQSFNRRFQPTRTDQDWLSRDTRVVDAFLADERCGFIFSASAFRDMFEGLLFITDPRHIRQTPAELPVQLLAGTEDPVGGFGKMVKQAYDAYLKAGMHNVAMKLYEGMRHEILNEVGKEQVYDDIIAWMKANKLIE